MFGLKNNPYGKFIFLAVIVLFLIAGCDRQKRYWEEAQAKLCGQWEGSANIIVPGYYIFASDSVEISRTNDNSISYDFNIAGVEQKVLIIILEYNPSDKNYLLTVNADFAVSLERVPLTYSEETGFTGSLRKAINGQEYSVDAKITMQEDGGHVWEVSIAPEKGETYIEYKMEFSKEEEEEAPPSK